MKSSTIRRSALSKESMDVFENLANETPTDYTAEEVQSSDNTPSEYYREQQSKVENKSQEIDLLWQTFKSAQFNTNSTFMHVLSGFILGVITTLVTVSLIAMFAANSNSSYKAKGIMSIFANKTQTEKIQDEVQDAANLIEEQNAQPEETETPKVITSEISEDVTSQDNTVSNIKTKKYVIKDGDTVEAIIKKNYGTYSPERAEAIMKANNLKDLDHISIDQVLLLPMEK